MANWKTKVKIRRNLNWKHQFVNTISAPGWKRIKDEEGRNTLSHATKFLSQYHPRTALYFVNFLNFQSICFYDVHKRLLKQKERALAPNGSQGTKKGTKGPSPTLIMPHLIAWHFKTFYPYALFGHIRCKRGESWGEGIETWRIWESYRRPLRVWDGGGNGQLGNFMKVNSSKRPKDHSTEVRLFFTKVADHIAEI